MEFDQLVFEEIEKVLALHQEAVFLVNIAVVIGRLALCRRFDLVHCEVGEAHQRFAVGAVLRIETDAARNAHADRLPARHRQADRAKRVVNLFYFLFDLVQAFVAVDKGVKFVARTPAVDLFGNGLKFFHKAVCRALDLAIAEIVAVIVVYIFQVIDIEHHKRADAESAVFEQFGELFRKGPAIVDAAEGVEVALEEEGFLFTVRSGDVVDDAERAFSVVELDSPHFAPAGLPAVASVALSDFLTAKPAPCWIATFCPPAKTGTGAT